MVTTESLFELYKTCFPNIIRDDETVRTVLGFPENHIITEENNGELIGAAVINQNTVFMLCVLPSFRNEGIGSRILSLAEQYVLGEGFDEIKFCDGKEYITPGIPMFASYDGNEKFFIKRGYVHSWDDAECVDMSMDLADFNATEKKVGDEVGGVLYRWAAEDDFDSVIECVEAGCHEFVEYYKSVFSFVDEGASTPDSASLDGVEINGEHSSSASNEKALLAIKDDKVCGALLVGNGTDMPGLGSVGCTVTHPDYRGRGIATTMVMLGTHYLQSLGLENAFLGYTYTDIIPMYGKSGYKVCMKYYMGVKKL